MKKHLLNLAMLGFLALTGTVGFTACSDDAVAGSEPSVNPGPNNETKVKNVNFVMNVEYGQPATTRQSAATVQIPNTTSNTFRGIEEAKLLPYIVAGTPGFLSEADATGASKVPSARLFDLAKLYTDAMASNKLDGTTSENENTTTSSRRVIELPMPLQANLMLIYGKAIKGTSTTEDMDAVQGKMVMDIQQDASQTNISLVSRLEDDEVEEYKKIERLSAFILNRILHARIFPRAEQTYTYEATHSLSGFVRSTGAYTWDYGAGKTPGAMAWSTLGETYRKFKNGEITSLDMTPLEEGLAAAYYELTSIRHASGTAPNITPGEYRAGSAGAISRLLYDLYILCEKTYNATPTQNAEADAIRLASRIGHQIFGFYAVDKTNQNAVIRPIGSNDATTQTIRYFIKSQSTGGSDPADPIVGVDDTDFSDTNGKFYGIADADLRTFPGCYGLPEGAAQLAYEKPSDTTVPTAAGDEVVKAGTPLALIDQFVYHYTNQPFVTDMTTEVPSFDPTHYMYPAELGYFVNSPLRVNETAVDATNLDTLFPNGTANWDDGSNWGAGWVQGPVTSSTNSIAVVKNVNYGVAMLKTTVAANTANLDDNRATLNPGETPQSIAVSGLKLTGILIGGQDKNVDWQYLPKGGDNTYVIYDSAVGEYNSTSKTYGGIQLNGVDANYTILFDNYTSDATQNSVRFALEFINAGDQDFWGKDNLIRKGGTFYLQGEMTLTSADATTLKWDDYYQVPPLNQSTGVSRKVSRVFIQDHMTIANVTLGPGALKQAVVSVPDLRTSQTSLGLSVDLIWQQGLTFTPVIGPTP